MRPLSHLLDLKRVRFIHLFIFRQFLSRVRFEVMYGSHFGFDLLDGSGVSLVVIDLFGGCHLKMVLP